MSMCVYLSVCVSVYGWVYEYACLCVCLSVYVCVSASVCVSVYVWVCVNGGCLKEMGAEQGV